MPKANRLVATSTGVMQRRRQRMDGKPECVPLLPHEIATRQSDLGVLDYSALAVRGADLAALDPLERERLRQMIGRFQGDRALAGLSDDELDGALGLTTVVEGQARPTVAGLLLIGREPALRQNLPTHEVAFQVLDGTDVKVNEFFRTPLLRTFERVEEMFLARVEERELQFGLFRVPVPTLDREVFREALVNALTHRDYTRIGAVHVQWNRDDLVISNPGGFVEGITLRNLLVAPPRPRNPALADAFKRIGLAERTGRGVDKIFAGMLRYGHPRPDYGRSDATTVVVRLDHTTADLPFLQMIIEEEGRTGTPLPVDALVALAQIREERRASTAQIAEAIQRDEAAARKVVERLVEAGIVEAHGNTRARTYTLSAKTYRQLDAKAEYIRQAGFDVEQQEQMVVSYARKHGSVRRSDVMELCRISGKQATRLLGKLVADGHLVMSGARKTAAYAPANAQKKRGN
ncbi:MAG: winged helix DNA-binding protein [Deltaproteobacteria bacterium]|nr:winged helix DNA-binding protein [Deltaproteobacteria bacterium]